MNQSGADGEATMFGPYRLDSLLGRGGMGEVWQAYDTRRGRSVALKRLSAQWAADTEFQDRFRREAQLTARLNSVHVIPIHDFGEIEGRLFVDMRMVTGGDLAAVLATHPDGLRAARAVEITTQLAAALDAAHGAGMVHRDVKPSNVLLEPDGDGDLIYLVDFGIAKLAVEAGPRMTRTGTTLGTPAYMAPELFRGAGAASVASDVYALGCVLGEMLTGRRPFSATEPARLLYQHLQDAPSLPSEHRAELAPWDRVVAVALAKPPGARFASAGALARAAAAALDPDRAPEPASSAPQAAVQTLVPSTSRPPDGSPGPAWAPPRPAPSTPEPPSGARRRRIRLIAAVVAVVLIVAVGVGIVGAASGRDGPSAADPSTAGTPSAGAPLRLAAAISAAASGVDVSPDGRRVYVSSGGASPSSSTVTVVDPATAGGQVVATLPVGAGPADAAISPDGRRAYVINNLASTISVLDTATGAVTATLPAGGAPDDIVLSPDGTRAYVTILDAGPDAPGALSIIDTGTGALIASARVGVQPVTPSVSPDGRRVYVPNQGGSTAGTTVSVVDATTATVVATLPTAATPRVALVGADGRRLFVVGRGDTTNPRGSLQVIDLVSGATTTLPAGVVDSPTEAALSPDQRTLVVVNSGVNGGSGSVSVVDLSTNTLRRRELITGSPVATVVAPDSHRAYVVTDGLTGGLWQLDLT